MKTGNGQRIRQELEEEVAMLQKMLSDEKRVHEILQRALLPNGIPSTVHIPNFLPKMAKELLAELFMLEEEIARLEREISKGQQSLIASCSQSSPFQTTRNTNVFEDKMAFGSKPMFFINQAMKGVCSRHSFSTREGSLKTARRMERQIMATNNQERIPRKSEIMEILPSPKKPPKAPSPRLSDHKIDTSQKLLLHEPTLITSPLDNNDQHWQPNKLSEKILKCLICMFLRLMRTSRSMELEKSSYSISRTSFRVDNSLALNSTLNIQRTASQKDPYGIFQMEDSLARDIGPYKNFVRFTSSSLELRGISICLPLLNILRNLISNLHKVDLKSLNYHQKLAFWINIHNICIMHGFLEHGLPSDPDKILGLRNKAVLNIGGIKLNALAIEHFILRHPSVKNESVWMSDKEGKEEEEAIRVMYGLDQAEPNVQFALCFGNRSSPSVKIYTSDGVSAELEKSKLEYLQASIVVTTLGRIMIPKLLYSIMFDIAEDLDSLIEWICSQLPTSGTLRKSITECVIGQDYRKISDIVDILPFDFEFQYLLLPM